MKLIPIAGWLVAASAVGVAAWSAPALVHGSVATTQAVAASETDDHGGFDAPLTVEIVPVAMRAGAAGSELEVELDVKNVRKANVAMAWAYELLDAKGRAVKAASQKSERAQSLGAKAEQTIGGLAIPANLPAGYYKVKATVAWNAPDEGRGTDSSYAHFLVKGGSVTPVSAEEFLTRSNASEGEVAK